MMALAFTPGQIVAAPDWEALFAQHGGAKSNTLRRPTKAEQDAALESDDDLEQNPIYRYYAEDGSFVEARKAPNGDYQIVDYKPSATFTQAQTRANSAAAGAADDWHTEGTPDGQGGFDNSRPIMVRTVNGKREERPPTAKELRDWQEAGQMTRNPGGKTDAELAAANKPQIVATNTTEPYIVTQENGQLVTRPNPNYQGPKPEKGTNLTVKGGDGKTYIVPIDAQGNPGQARDLGIPGETPNKYTQTKQDPQTGKWYGLTPGGQWEAMEGGPALPPDKSGFATEPSGAPAFSAQYGAIVEQSLTKYRNFLDAKVKAQDLTPADADKLMASRLAQVRDTMAEQQAVINTQAGLFGQQISQRGQTLSDTAGRRTAAGNIHSTIMQSFMPLLKYMPLGGGQAFLDLLTHGMEEGLKNAAKWGGLRESPEIQMGPAAAAANRATLPGQAPVPGLITNPYQPAPAAPGDFDVNVNQGAGAPVVAPRPDAQAATDAAAAAAAQAQSIRQNPVFRPQPQVVMPPVAPPPTVPGATPLGLAPPSFLQPYQQPQPPAGSGLARLLADPDIDNALVAQAYSQVYGAPLPGFG